MIITKDQSPAEKEAGLRESFQQTEQKLFDLTARLADTFIYYRKLQDDLAQISIYGAEKYFSPDFREKMKQNTATSGYDF